MEQSSQETPRRLTPLAGWGQPQHASAGIFPGGAAMEAGARTPTSAPGALEAVPATFELDISSA